MLIYVGLYYFLVTDNKIGAEGAKAIGEALKTNEILIDLGLSGEE